MNYPLFLRLFPLLLLVGMLLTVAFVHRFEEPYPAIYQPAFQYASPDTDQITTQVADVVAHTADGQTIALDYEDLFRFAPDNRDVFLFRMLPDSVPAPPPPRAPARSWRKQLKRWLFADYRASVQKKRASEYPTWLASLETSAEARAGQDVTHLTFTLYDITYNLSSGDTERQHKATKELVF